MKKITIAIDGYSATGKSTLAKGLAKKLNYIYVDSGAMYRAVALYALRNNLIDDARQINVDKLIEKLKDIDIQFVFNPSKYTSETYLNGENVEREIRTPLISDVVSKISSIKEVRQFLVEKQREYGKNKGIVMDGRDIGTNVFPDAELKLFVITDLDVRVKRRLDELHSKGIYATEDEVKKNLQERDYLDIHRKENPLVQAKDAVVLDTTDLDKDQQLEYVLKLIKDLKLLEE
ncbi:MAG: (d)CMP kinase [Bacteroidetes bacterium]|nr:MAG: (d)CMP kinase [Bacteroidota bacterium]